MTSKLSKDLETLLKMLALHHDLLVAGSNTGTSTGMPRHTVASEI